MGDVDENSLTEDISDVHEKDYDLIIPGCSYQRQKSEDEAEDKNRCLENTLLIPGQSFITISNHRLDDNDEINSLYCAVPELANLFLITCKIGEGAFSCVYLAKLKQYPEVDETFALKHIIPTTHPTRIHNELKCLLEIGYKYFLEPYEILAHGKIIPGSQGINDKIIAGTERLQAKKVGGRYPSFTCWMSGLLGCVPIDILEDFRKSLTLFVEPLEKGGGAIIYEIFNLRGCDNVMDVKLCVRHKDHVVFVMPVFFHDKFQDYLHNMAVDEVREYMKNLLIALRRVHQFNVIHRDIKPSNFLYNRQKKSFSLVDFGLASGPMLLNRDADKQTSEAKDKGIAKDKGLSEKIIRVALSPSKLDPSNNIMRPKTGIKGIVGQRRTTLPGKGFKLSLPSTSAASVLADYRGGCDCFGKHQICSVCVSRPNQIAPRAGTAGFRSPEVLMKCKEQGTAVDIWSAGVIFLSLLSSRYPFFRAQDDMGYLTQIISLLGSNQCSQAAEAIGKILTVSEPVEAVDLKTACTKLRQSVMSYKLGPSSSSYHIVESWKNISDEPYDLLYKMLDPNPHTRITAQEALEHPFFKEPCS